ncbi:MAG: hypothetical protein D6744_14150 [Planctomycetota bacterium]|nr:MAG: hypothetical protein D6744_14150 [Planctomycetota bacterium]
MHALRYGAAVTLSLLSICGCVAVVSPAPTPSAPVKIELFNATGRDVRPNLFVSGSATSEDALFVGGNLFTSFTDRAFAELRAGETVTLEFDCDELSAAGVDRPVAFDALALDVDTAEERIVLIRDTNYDCGATLRFVFFYDGAVFRVRSE